jgi:ABC-type glycerol-3-phosphate transport system substrate-binding protein
MISESSRKITRRRLLATTAASTALIAMPYVRGAYAAGKLSIGLWDHWVPGANDVSRKIIQEWGEKEKVDVTVDYITSQGEKLRLTMAAEAQAKSGHDLLNAGSVWDTQAYAELFEPMNDIMEPLIKQNGAVNPTVEYLGRSGDKWLAVPGTIGSQIKGPCSRIDLLKQHAGIDIQAMYPAGSPPKADGWNLDTFVKAAEACQKAGFPFGIGLGTTSDSVDSAGAFFHAFGAVLVDKNSKILVKSDPVRQVLDYYKKLASFMPPEIPAWNDSDNNKMLIQGKASLIMNPPSAWAVAKRDAPQVAEQCWTHGFPVGPKGRFAPFLPFFLCTWAFGKNKSAVKSLLVHLSQPANVERLVAASEGYDIPSFANLAPLKVYAEQGPPKGTLYHYPNPHNHQVLSIAASEAPPKIAHQIYAQAIMTKMIVRYIKGDPMEKTLSWAEGELEGMMRS